MSLVNSLPVPTEEDKKRLKASSPVQVTGGSSIVDILPPPPTKQTAPTSSVVEELPPPPAEPRFTAPPEGYTGPKFIAPAEAGEYGKMATGSSDVVPEQQLDAISKRYGVDKEYLRDSAAFLNAAVQLKSGLDIPATGAKYMGGLLASMVSLGWAPKFRIEAEKSPNIRRALEEIRDLGLAQRGMLSQVGEGITSPSVLGKLATGTGTAAKIAKPFVESGVGRIATGTLVGGVAGAGTSREGEEAAGFKSGAQFGAAIGTGGEVLGAGLRTVDRLRKGTKEAVLEEAVTAPKMQQTDADAAVATERMETAETDDILKKIVLGEKKSSDISDGEFRSLIKENPNTWQEIQQSRLEEAGKRGDISSKMASVDAEYKYTERQLSKRPSGQLDINTLEKDLINTKNDIKNTKNIIGTIENQITDLQAKRAERITYEEDLPGVSRPIEKLDLGIDTRLSRLEQLQARLEDLNATSEMLRANIVEGPGMNREAARLNKKLDTLRDEYQTLSDRRSNIPSVLGEKKTAKELFVERLAEKRKLDLASELSDAPVTSLKKAEELIYENRQRNFKYLGQRYELLLDIKAAERARDKGTLQVKNPTGYFESLRDKNLYTPFALQKIDDVHNQNNAAAKARLSRGRTQMINKQEELRPDRWKISQLAEEADVLDKMLNTDLFIAAIERGKVGKISAGAQKVAKAIGEYQDKVLKMVNEDSKRLGIPPMAIEKISNYITRMTVDTPTLIAKVDASVRAAAEDVSKRVFRPVSGIEKITGNELARMVKQETVPQSLTNLIEFVRWRSKDSEYFPISGEELLAQINKYTQGSAARDALETQARATISRRGSIPDFIREKRVPHILDRYTKDLLSDLYQRVPLDELRTNAKILRAAGSTRDAELIENMIADTIGIREGTYNSAVQQAKISATRAVTRAREKTNNPAKLALLDIVETAPDAINYLSKRVYNNLLGSLKIAPATRNAIGNYCKAISELNNVYGNSVFFRAMLDAVVNFKGNYEISKARGYQVTQVVAGAQKDLSTGIFRSKALSTLESGITKLENIGMFFQWVTETFNHSVMIAASKTMTKDLVKNKALAFDALKNFPKKTQIEVINNLNNPEKTAEILADYFKERVLLTYDTPSKAEFARTVGPVLSTFSTWPTAQLGELTYDIQRLGGIGAGGRKQLDRYLLPVLVAYQLDKILDEKYPEYKGAKKLIVGSGFFTASPIDAYRSWMRGDQFTPPAIDVLAKIAVPAAKGEGLKAARGLDAAAQLFTPNIGFLDNFFNIWVEAITGVPNTGTTKSEKILEGIERVTK
jgi:hypothetical protein